MLLQGRRYTYGSLTKLVQSRWLHIGLILFIIVIIIIIIVIVMVMIMIIIIIIIIYSFFSSMF